jgi:hypothetical protein
VEGDALAQVLQPISIRRRRADVDRRTVSVEQMEVETLATEWLWPSWATGDA